VTDRVVQAALKLVLEPILEADFQPCSLSVSGLLVNGTWWGLVGFFAVGQAWRTELGSRWSVVGW
jgi:hypothetical protein